MEFYHSNDVAGLIGSSSGQMERAGDAVFIHPGNGALQQGSPFLLSRVSSGPKFQLNLLQPAGVILRILVLLALGMSLACEPGSGQKNSDGPNPSPEGSRKDSRGGPPLSGLPQAHSLRVADGDTLVADIAGQEVKIRLHGVDAPELDQKYGLAARKCLKSLLKNSTFYVKTEYEDPYGRSVATLISPSNEDLNAVLVRRGCAWAFLRYSQKYVSDEKVAREQRKGLWAGEDPVPPWTWRRRSPVKTDR